LQIRLRRKDTYLQELVRYIHLNPLRAKIVKTLTDSDKYPYSGHSALMGKIKRDFQDSDNVLRLYGKKVFTVKPRSLMCYWAVRRLGFSATEISKKLGVSQPSVSISVKRGEKIANAMQLELIEERKL
jgi:hypothetical protein